MKSGKEYKFIEEFHGIEMTKNEALNDVQTSINELNDRLNEAIEFKKKLESNEILGPNDTYLSFAAVIVNGYDRTGPGFVVLDTEEEGID